MMRKIPDPSPEVGRTDLAGWGAQSKPRALASGSGDSRARRPYRLAHVFCVMVFSSSALTAGCSLLTEDYYSRYREPPEQLHKVMAVRLEEMSRTEPVSVEDAAEDAAEDVAAEEAAAIEQPPESLDLSLADVRAAALAGNLDLNVEFVNPSIQQEFVNEAEAQFEALFYGSIQHQKTDQPARVVDGSADQSESTSYNLGVRIPLRTGGTATVDLPMDHYDDQTEPTGTAGDNSLFIDPSYDMGLRFSISQPLLRGAGVRVNTHAIRVAKYQRDIVDARTKLSAIRILADADRAYWRLFAARRELIVRQQQYELALQQLDMARKRVAAGDSPEIEIMRAESGVAARLEFIIITDTYVRRRERELKRIMNRPELPMDTATALIPTTDPNPLGLDLDAEALAEFALENRMEMLELEVQLAIDASSIDFERNSKLPLFLLDYTYRVNGFAGGFNQAFRDLGDHDYADHTLALQAEIPLGAQAAKSRLRRALLQRVQRLATREQRRLAIQQEVYDSVDMLEQDWQRILAARQEVVLAGRAYEAEKKYFEVGYSNSTEVLNAAARLAGAQSREIQALTAYEISLIDIAYATGALIGQSDVIWRPTPLD